MSFSGAKERAARPRRRWLGGRATAASGSSLHPAGASRSDPPI